MKKVLVIAGPTAVGKTALSIEWAQRFNGEIISGDSMQVYENLNIGTAKVTPEEQEGVAHHLINCRKMTETYSVADFQKEGRIAIEAISQQGKLPIVVGGTGLYLQALLYDFDLGSKTATLTPEEKQAFQDWTQTLSEEALWQKLAEKDEVTARNIHPHNRRRVERALEVVLKTGHSFQQKEAPKPLYDFFFIVLHTERQRLYERINKRVDQMLQQGLEAEARRLYACEACQSQQGIGYKEFFPYFAGRASLEEVRSQIQQNSRRYAKRQLTWFRNRMQGEWLDILSEPEAKEKMEKKIQQWLEG